MHCVSESGLATARRCTQLLYHNSSDALVEMSQAELQELFGSAPYTELTLEPGTTILDMVMKAKCFNRTGRCDVAVLTTESALHQ